MTGGGTTSTTLTWDADQERLKLARGNDTWEMIYDPSAGIPAVLLSKNYVSSSTTYMYNVREPEGELLCSFDASETPNKYYYHFDDLGSTVLVTDSSGTKVSSYTYGAWGDIPASSGTDLRPYQYVGKLGYYRHASAQGTALADLMQLGVRFYDAESGRFTQLDPLGEDLNGYVYVDASPTEYVDPFGLKKRRPSPKPPEMVWRNPTPPIPKPKPGTGYGIVDCIALCTSLSVDAIITLCPIAAYICPTPPVIGGCLIIIGFGTEIGCVYKCMKDHGLPGYTPSPTMPNDPLEPYKPGKPGKGWLPPRAR